MKARNWEKGFTLIELLVVVAIIGILAAIAIPQYATYKKQAADAQAKSDIHNMATALEAYYGSNGNSYAGADNAALTNYGWRQSSSVKITPTGAASTYTIAASANGGSALFTFNAATGSITP